jgi:predicted Co/Zn/Cd cation transporter (cation efflux family)
MTSKPGNLFLPVQLLFLAAGIFIIAGKSLLNRWNVDVLVLTFGNLLIFLVTWFSFYLAQKGLNNSNPNVFFRYVYISIMVKLFACVIIAFIYIFINKGNLNKPALFSCMGLYLVYTFAEVSVLMKLLKQKKHE